ncbi:MAG: ABC transporter permease [Deltaproteobacteria bacterium]
MFERIVQIIRKEFIQMLRDYRMRVVIFALPVFQVLLFGLAASTDVKTVRTAVYDTDNSRLSRELVRGFSFSGYFPVVRRIATQEEMDRLVDEGSVMMVIRTDKGFERYIRKGVPAPLQIVVDGTDSNTAGIALNYASTIVRDFSLRLAGQETAGPSVDLRYRAWFNENLDSKIYLVPGVVALIVLMVTLLLTAMAIVREKESGTIDQLIVSPVRPVELILGKFFPYSVIGVIDVFLVTLAAVILFRVPVRGSLVLLFLSSCLFLMTSLGTGLFISTISHTMQEAQFTLFFFVQPMTMLSGFVFPVENMPRLVQWITVLDPLKYYITIVRGLYLKDVGLRVIWPDMLGLLIIGAGIITVSSLIFKRTLA